MVQDEIDIVRRLTDTEKKCIQFSDNGFLSRGYVVDDGRIVFKFKKDSDVSYKNEIRVLEYIRTLDLGVNLQRVGWKSEDDSYLGLYGVPGRSLEALSMTPAQKQEVGRQLGLFLKKLHAAKPQGGIVYRLEDEISAWKERFISSKAILETWVETEELEHINKFVMHEAPEGLRMLGERLVFSHGDLGEGNIYIDDSGNVGVIDFNESGFLDEAADFMDIDDDCLCEEMLTYYGADETLRKKVALRRSLRSMFVVGIYAGRGETAIQKYIQKIRAWFKKR